MSFAPVEATLKGSAGVTALLGTNPTRVWPQGQSPAKGTTLYGEPYAVFQQITGQPENYLGTLPDVDDSTTQIDVYAATVSAARAVAIAIRNAVEPVAYVVALREMGKDATTNLSRISMDVDWITNR